MRRSICLLGCGDAVRIHCVSKCEGDSVVGRAGGIDGPGGCGLATLGLRVLEALGLLE